MEVNCNAPLPIQIKSGNELIAVFMGGIFNSVPNNSDKWKFGSQPTRYYREDAMHVNLKYHDDWNWMMPVIEKIESLGFDVTIQHTEDLNSCYVWDGTPTYKRSGNNIVAHEDFGSSKLGTVWVAVLEFIKKYNSQELLTKQTA